MDKRYFFIIITALLIMSSAGIAGAEEAKVQDTITPKKIGVDSNYDGKTDRIEIYDATGQITRVEVDNNADGSIDEWIVYENGKPAKREKDTNGDKKPDVWIEY